MFKSFLLSSTALHAIPDNNGAPPPPTDERPAGHPWSVPQPGDKTNQAATERADAESDAQNEPPKKEEDGSGDDADTDQDEGDGEEDAEQDDGQAEDRNAAGADGKPAAEKTPIAAADKADDEFDDKDDGWQMRQIDRQHRKIKERDTELARLRQQNTDLIALAGQTPPAEGDGAAPAARAAPQPGAAQPLTHEDVQRAAQAIVEQDRFKDNVLKMNADGTAAYGEKWGKALNRLASFGEMDAADMQVVLSTDNPAQVLYELGRSPAEYERISALPAAKRATEFVKLSLKKAEPAKKISDAPSPTKPIKQSVAPASQAAPSDKDDDDTWYAKRAKQKAARREGRAAN